MKQWYYAALMVVTLAFVGCSSKGGEKSADAMGDGDKGAFTAPPVLQDDRTQLGGIDDQSVNGTRLGGIPATRIIHFDYDKYDIRASERDVLQQHAQYLKGGAKVRLEGHADERGSLEYNYALGEKRANSAKNTLKLFGVSDDQVNILSYGETMPMNPGHNESAWQQNRRVELAYP